MSIRIIGTGSYLPRQRYEKPKNPGDYSNLDDIDFISGLGFRHVCDSRETSTYMGSKAAESAINSADIDPSSIDAIICYTAVADYETPRDVYKIAAQIGCDGAMCWTIDTACASFLTHLHCAYSLSFTGTKRILLISSMNWITRAFNENEGQFAGDGAGAVVVEYDSRQKNYIASMEISSTEQFDFIKMRSSQATGNHEEIQFTKNKHIILRSINILPEIANKLIDQQGIHKNDIKWVICHQPGMPAIERWHDLLEISLEKNLNTYDLYGNMSAANIPITIDHYLNHKPLLKNDDLVLLFSAGAGIHVVATLYRF